MAIFRESVALVAIVKRQFNKISKREYGLRRQTGRQNKRISGAIFKNENCRKEDVSWTGLYDQ